MRRVLKPGGKLLFIEHGRSDDAQVARWQDRWNPIQNVIGCGCNVNRKIDALVRAGRLPRSTSLERFLAEGAPRMFGEMYRGRRPCAADRRGKPAACGGVQRASAPATRAPASHVSATPPAASSTTRSARAPGRSVPRSRSRPSSARGPQRGARPPPRAASSRRTPRALRTRAIEREAAAGETCRRRGAARCRRPRARRRRSCAPGVTRSVISSRRSPLGARGQPHRERVHVHAVADQVAAEAVVARARRRRGPARDDGCRSSRSRGASRDARRPRPPRAHLRRRPPASGRAPRRRRAGRAARAVRRAPGSSGASVTMRTRPCARSSTRSASRASQARMPAGGCAPAASGAIHGPSRWRPSTAAPRRLRPRTPRRARPRARAAPPRARRPWSAGSR